MKTSVLFILLFTLLLTACSSVPIATMMHFSDAKPDDFFMVDPKGIIVKVTINNSANFDASRSVNLSATIEDESGLRHFIFPLLLVNKAIQAAKSGFFSEQAEFDIYTLKLSEEAIKNLAIIKAESQSGVQKKVGLTAGINFSKDQDKIDEDTVLSIALKLTESGSYITLIDNLAVTPL